MPDRRIFISYRRGDAAAHAGRLHDQLVARYGPNNVFMDIDTIQPGDDFVEAITVAIDSCHVFLALIGPTWLSGSDGRGRRLDNPNDYVRIELQTALTRSIRVIPLLVQDTRMPADEDLPGPLRPLARRQAFELSDQRWKRDVAELVERLDGPATGTLPVTDTAPEGPPIPAPDTAAGPAAPPGRRRPVAAIALAAAGVLLLVVAALVAVFAGGRSTAVEAPVPVGRGPNGITAGEGFVWVANTDDGTVSRIDPDTGQVSSIPVGGQPIDLRVGDGAVWVWNHPAAITRVDIASGIAGEPIPAAAGEVTGIAFGAGYVWLSHGPAGLVSRVSAATQAADGPPIEVGGRVGGTAFGNGWLYVLDTERNALLALDGSSGHILTDSPTPLPGTIGGLQVDDGVIYVGTTDGITRVDETSLVVGRPIPLEDAGQFQVGGGWLWVSYPLEDVVRRLDLRELTPVEDPVPGVGRGLTQTTFAAHRLWATRAQRDDVVRIRLESG